MFPMTPEPTRFTQREKIMRHLVARFEAPPLDGDDVQWNFVTRKPMTASAISLANCAIGFYDTSETVSEGVGWELRTVNVVAEFHLKLSEGDDPAVFLNHGLGSTIRRVGIDIHMGGLALNTKEKGSELDIDGAFDKYVSGILVFGVSYRCRPNDPYTPV